MKLFNCLSDTSFANLLVVLDDVKATKNTPKLQQRIQTKVSGIKRLEFNTVGNLRPIR